VSFRLFACVDCTIIEALREDERTPVLRGAHLIKVHGFVK